jgi:hypothetical protein
VIKVRIAIVLALLLLCAQVGEWVYRSFVRPIPLVPPQVLALERAFGQAGLPVHAFAVDSGRPAAQVSSAAAFKVRGVPLPIVVLMCPTEDAASAVASAMAATSPPWGARHNGHFVLALPGWEAEGEGAATARKAISVFEAYREQAGGKGEEGEKEKAAERGRPPG